MEEMIKGSQNPHFERFEERFTTKIFVISYTNEFIQHNITNHFRKQWNYIAENTMNKLLHIFFSLHSQFAVLFAHLSFAYLDFFRWNAQTCITNVLKRHRTLFVLFVHISRLCDHQKYPNEQQSSSSPQCRHHNSKWNLFLFAYLARFFIQYFVFINSKKQATRA